MDSLIVVVVVVAVVVVDIVETVEATVWTVVGVVEALLVFVQRKTTGMKIIIPIIIGQVTLNTIYTVDENSCFLLQEF